MSKGLKMSKGIAGKFKKPRSFGGGKSAAPAAGANTLEQSQPAGDTMSDYARMMAAGGA
jgi:hypothetical protein